MIATDTFSHTGANGSDQTARMTAAGYALNGSWATGENIGWATTRFPEGLQDEVDLLHSNLMNSSGHRANILNTNYREIGIGFEIADYGGRESAFVTEDFGETDTSALLTGVAFDNKDGGRFYDPGEGLGSITVTITTTGGALIGSTTTMDAGGYDIPLAAGTYNVTFSGGGVTSTTQQVTIGSSNVKVGPRRSGDDGRRSAVPAPAGKHRRHSVWRKPPGTDSFKFNTSLFNMNLADFLVI